MTKKLMLFVPTCAALWVFGASTARAGYETPPTPSCPDGTHELKIDYPSGDKEYPIYGTDKTVRVKSDGYKVDWSSDLGMDSVIAIAGYYAKEYSESAEMYSGKGLHAGMDPKAYKPYKLTRIKFCYDLELKVSKTAEADVKSQYDWKINKTAYPRESYDKTLTVDYKVELEPTLVVKDVVVTGKIVAENKTKFEAKIIEVKDVLSDGTVAEVDCGVPISSQYPYKLGPYKTLICYYKAYPDPYTDLNGLKNTAYVKTAESSKVGGDSAKVPVTVKYPSAAKDRCVHLTDALEGSSDLELDKKVCADDPYLTFEYYRTFDLNCGDNYFKNVATIVGKDTYRTWYDQAVVNKYVKCDGCTRTQGFWKTHSTCPKAQGQDAAGWENVGGSEAKFLDWDYLTWCGVLWTPPAGGNAWYILAHQFIAAYLNKLVFADSSQVDGILAKAYAFFTNPHCGPTTWQEDYSKCPYTKETLNAWADLLDKFNRGELGPPHCD